jgi:hypothetical protein
MHLGRLAIGAMALAALALPACVSRKLSLRSEPSGAAVILDGQRVGTTPYEEEIPAWGTRHLELELEGHERLAVDLELATPWWDYWPLDMLAAVAPWTVRRDYDFAFELAPAAAPELSWEAVDKALQRAQRGPEPQP